MKTVNVREEKISVNKTVKWLTEEKKTHEQDKGIRISWFEPLKHEEPVPWLKRGTASDLLAGNSIMSVCRVCTIPGASLKLPFSGILHALT